MKLARSTPKVWPKFWKISRLTIWSAMPLAFFGALLLTRAFIPKVLMFDEVHYIPAAKALLLGTDNLNWVHPPLGKYLMGLGWWIFSDRLHLIGEPAVFRWVAVGFGLWSLWAVRAWMLALGFAGKAAMAAVWLTGFNFIWFVQSKTGMLDIFYIAFALWGLLDVWRFKRGWRSWRGWILLGCSLACKWSAAPYILLALFLAASPWLVRLAGGAVAGLTYVITFIPLGFLKNNPVPLSDLIDYHQRMLAGFDQIAGSEHPYRSSFWEWPTLARPVWYLFDSSSAGERCIWASGNPVLFWTVFPLLFVVVWFALRHGDRIARVLSALYWVPLLFWALAPRKLQLFYYYLAPAFMLGPIVVWAHERLGAGGIFVRGGAGEIREARGWLLLGFVLLCAASFVYFLPIMDGRLLPPGRFQDYMWFRSWI